MHRFQRHRERGKSSITGVQVGENQYSEITLDYIVRNAAYEEQSKEKDSVGKMAQEFEEDGTTIYENIYEELDMVEKEHHL